MKSRIVTNMHGETVYVTVDGDVLDAIAYAYYQKHERNTEALIEANPHLLDYGLILPAGVSIKLPVIPRQEAPRAFRQLWD